MPASNVFGAIQKGLLFADQREQQQQQNEFNKQQQFIKLDDQRKGALFQDARMVNTFLKNNQTDRAMDVLSQRLNAIDQFGGDNTDTNEIISLINQGDIQGATSLLDSVEEAGVGGGFLSDPLDRQLRQAQIDNLKVTKVVKQTPLEKAQSKVDFEFKKEERGVAKAAVVGFNKRASEIRSSFGKVESILGSGKLNRMKIASAMTSMARLLSPGIVTNQDFINLSNSSSPVATLMSTLTGKGDDGKGIAENLQRFVDPTNPDLFDKESFLTTARNVAGAEIPALIDSFNDAKGRAERAGISEKALSTNFEKNKNFTFLSGMLEKSKPVLNHQTLGQITEGQVQETMKNKNMTREQVMALLNQG